MTEPYICIIVNNRERKQKETYKTTWFREFIGHEIEY